MKLIRLVLGKLILFFDALIPPSSLVSRTPSEQARVDQETKKLALYEYKACPFCVKVKRTIKALKLNVEKRDAKSEGAYRSELISQGGKPQVPCLRVEHATGKIEWMYESSVISAYLKQNFGSLQRQAA